MDCNLKILLDMILAEGENLRKKTGIIVASDTPLAPETILHPLMMRMSFIRYPTSHRILSGPTLFCQDASVECSESDEAAR